jgi:hypothetical protein
MAGKSRFERVPFQPASGDAGANLRLQRPFNFLPKHLFPKHFPEHFFPKQKDPRRSHERNRGNLRFLRKLLFVQCGDDKRPAFVALLRTKC